MPQKNKVLKGIKILIRVDHKTGRVTYGPRRILAELRAIGLYTGRHQITR
jgi:hypothetical protein